MTLIDIVYRATVYAPRSVDPAEATVLTPAAGAPHSDQFKVATREGVAGFQPYLGLPSGRTGRIDVLSRQTDVGVMTFELLDRKLVAGDNLQRWVTAYFGNLKQEYRVGGLKIVIERSTDGGATFAAWFQGRLQTVALQGKVRYACTAQDELSEFNQLIFVGRPHSSIAYAGVASILPIGPSAPYGTLAAVAPFAGAARAQVVGGNTIVNAMVIGLNPDQLRRPDLLTTTNLVGAVAPSTKVFAPSTSLGGPFEAAMPNFSGPARARLTHTSGANNGLTGDYRVGQLLYSWVANPNHTNVGGFSIQALPTTEASYLALPAAGVTVTGYIIADVQVSSTNPLLIDATSPIALLQDILAGKFGFVWHDPEVLPPGKAYGDVKRAYPVNSGNFASFLADATYPPVRFIVPKSAKMGQWIQDNLLKPYSLVMFLDVDGKINLVDLRLPATLAGIATLTDADLVDADQQLAWSFDRSQAISRVDAKRYSDRITSVLDLNASPDATPTITAGMLQSIEHQIILLGVGTGDFGDAIYAMDGAGYRSMDGETYQNQSRAAYLENALLEHMSSIRRPFAVGASTISLLCAPTANVPTVPGGLLLLSLSALPDPGTNKRGGTGAGWAGRLVRVVSVGTGDGPTVRLDCLDLALAAVAAAPSAAQPAQEASNGSVGVTTAVTLNASGQQAELRFAVTPTSTGSAPANTSALWNQGPYGTNPILATGTVTFRPAVPGQRVWVQVRTMPAAGTLPQLPSAWALAAGTGYVDLAGWPAPSALTKTLDTGRAFLLGWTNGATDLMVQVLIRSPVGDPPTLIATLPPGSTQYPIVGTDPSTTYRLGVRYFDGRNYSAEVTADFTTGASSATSPAVLGISVLI